MHSFTQEDLLQYLYRETSATKTMAIKEALAEDWSLREKLNSLAAAREQLEVIKLSPRKQAIDNILNYADKKLEEFSSHA